MKKFAFSMQKLLEYTTHVEDNEKTVLQSMRRDHQELSRRLEALRQQIEVYRREYEEKCAGGIVMRELIVLREYMDEMEKQVGQFLVLLEESEREIDRQIDKIVGISKEKQSMDKLRDKYWQSYLNEQRKSEDVMIDEFVANAEFASKSRL